MAGIKVTDLPVLGAAAPDDVMYIVETLTGTSKQIAVGNFGISSIESTTLDVSIADGVATVDLPEDSVTDSGTWTPTISGEVGISPVVIREGWYIKVGNIVKATCGFSIEFDVTEQEQGFSFTLPIEPNNDFSTQFEIQGVAYNGTSILTTDKIEVLANGSTKDGYFIVTLTALGLSCNCVIDITYSIDN
jgi:hypothetical protein